MDSQNNISAEKSSLKKFAPLIGLAALLLLIVGGAYFLAPGQWAKIFGSTEISEVPTSENPEVEGGVVTQGNGYTIEEIPIESLRDSMPKLDRPIVFSASVPTEVRASLSANRDKLAANLEKDPSSGADWLDLALQYHSANDYEGARLVWEFLIKALPNDTTAYDNLGKLYHFSLKDYAKSESYFKQSLALKSDSTVPYLELYQLYKYSYKTGTTAMLDILKQGAAKFKENPDFSVLLGTEYAARGDTANARTWFEKALNLARAKGDVGLIARIGDELAKLPK